MKWLNKAIIIGRVDKDPESRGSVTSLRVETSDQWTDKNTGQVQTRKEWHRVTLFGKLAQVGLSLTAGAFVYVEGSIRTDKYKDKQGVDRYATSIIANDLHILGGVPTERQATTPRPTKAVQQDFIQQDFVDDEIPF